MALIHSVLLFLHLLGMAGILSGFLMQVMTSNVKAPKVILHSSLLQLLTGLILMGLNEMSSDAVDHIKLGIKLVVAFVIAIVALFDLRKPDKRLAITAGVLAVLNVAIAVFW